MSRHARRSEDTATTTNRTRTRGSSNRCGRSQAPPTLNESPGNGASCYHDGNKIGPNRPWVSIRVSKWRACLVLRCALRGLSGQASLLDQRLDVGVESALARASQGEVFASSALNPLDDVRLGETEGLGDVAVGEAVVVVERA